MVRLPLVMLPSHLVNVDPLLKAISVDNKAVGMLMVLLFFKPFKDWIWLCVCMPEIVIFDLNKDQFTTILF